jgi:DNA-binding SARP family transcriptional activator/ABC-type transport system substrate-binding protein/streptogramin lyase
MEVRVLGPLEVVAGGVSIPIGGGRQRKLLAILLLHANQFVSSDRLIDDLWGDDPPETAPKALQGYVSQLRKTLGADALVTRSGGYMLELAHGQLDLHRFEQLVDGAREAEPRDTAEQLREALALWRGPPLADFTYDDFAQSEIARLEERRLVALERRIDADLALGRHQEVAGELAALVRQHPLRERLRAQMMLALYRSGRQAEALEAFADARHALLDELGLEPSEELRQLQAAILEQDPALGAAPRTAWPRARRMISRPRFLGALGAILLLAAIGSAALVILGDSGDPALARAEPNSVAFLDPSSGELLGQAPARPTALLRFGDGFLWSMSVDGTLEQIDPHHYELVRRIGVGVHPGGLAVGLGSVWVSDADSPRLLRIDPRYESVDPIELPTNGGGAGGVSVGAGSVWLALGDAGVLRVDPETGRVERRWRVPDATDVQFADGRAWLVSGRDGVVRRVDPAANQITGSVRLGEEICCTAAGGGFVWVESASGSRVSKFSGLLNPSEPVGSVKLAGAGGALAYGAGALWATEGSAGTVTRVDARTDRTKTFTVGHKAGAIAVGDGLLAVGVGATAADSTAVRRGGVAQFISAVDWRSETDPAIATGPWQWQLEYATCAKLMNHPNAPAPAGWHVAPEVAAAPPTVSADGQTYSFRIGPGFRFSPPSNQPVTAETFRYTIERALSPRLGPKAVAAAFASDIAGVAAYRAGRSQHVSGIHVRGDTLTITLTKHAADLPSRMGLPYFCAVPEGTPIVPNGLDEPIPSAGPYYIAKRTEDVVTVLKRNPNYAGPRPQLLDAIVFRRPHDSEADAISELERGDADHVGEYDTNPMGVLVANPAYARRYGAPWQDGKPRYFVSPQLAIDYLAFNTRRPLFSDPRLRRAVNFALDRRPIADTYSWPPADHYLPPAMPGYRDSHLYPLGRPNLERARALARGRGGRAVLTVCDIPYCTQWARIIRENLAAIGIQVVVRVSSDPLARASAEDADMLLTRASATFPSSYQDPVTFLENVLGVPRSRTSLRQQARAGCPLCDVPPGWFSVGRFARKLERIRQLGGREREAAAGALDLELARAAPGAVLMSETYAQLFSAQMGCQKFQPLYFGVDIAALCMREDDSGR